MRKGKACKAIIETIHFSMNFDVNSWPSYADFCHYLLGKKLHELSIHARTEQVYILEGYEIISGIQRYPYGIRVQDEMRIYFANQKPDKQYSNYPVFICVDSQFLHMYSVEFIIDKVKWHVDKILKALYTNYTGIRNIDLKFTRIDICNHNNMIDLETYIKPNEYNSRTVTKIRKVYSVNDLIGENEQRTPYFRYGSGTVCIRFYNKIKEVCEQRYKHFFIEKWLHDGLIDLFTHEVYEYTYMLNGHYDLDFLFAHLQLSDNVNNKLELANIYNDRRITNDDKIDMMLMYIRKFRIKLCPEIVNVEYQLRHEFLKSLRISVDDGEKILDYTKIEDIVKHANILYKYLTNTVFWVVSRESNAGRKRDKLTDKIWMEIQKSNIENLDSYDEEKVSLYREYTTRMNLYNSMDKTLTRAANAFYQGCKEFDEETILRTNLDDVFKFIKEEVKIHENILNIKDKLNRQLKTHGYKNGDEKKGFSNTPDDDEI